MKRVITIFLMLLAVAGLAACKSETPTASAGQQAEAVAESQASVKEKDCCKEEDAEAGNEKPDCCKEDEVKAAKEVPDCCAE